MRDVKTQMLRMRTKTLLTILGTALVTTTALAIGFLVWFDSVWTVDKRFVRISPYQRANVPGEPAVSTCLYQLGEEMRFLLVLTSKSPKRREAYYIDAGEQKIGVADFGIYRPFWKGALVSWLSCDGFPLDGAIAADWDWMNDKRDLRIRVKGLLYPSRADGRLVPGMGDLSFGRDIFLVPLREKGS